MRHLLALTLIAIAATGCTTIHKQPIDAKAASNLKDQAVAQTVRKVPDFSAMTAGKAAFAMLGAIAMIAEGNSIVADNKVPDPANTIASALASSLQAAHGSRVVTEPLPVDSSDVAKVAQASHGKARFVLDVQTINWSFMYFPADWTHYRVLYTARARLIDAQTQAIVAEGSCKHFPETNDNAPTYDELVGNGAAGLKAQLSLAADACVKTLKTEMLAL